MAHSSHYFSRFSLMLLVVGPMALMAVLTWLILIPALKNPESMIYGSVVGYPSLKRLVHQPIKVKTMTVQPSSWETATAAAGESVPLQSVNIRPQVSGTVKSVAVVEGQQVRRGDRLVEIDAAPFQAEVEKAQLALKQAENEWQALLPAYQQTLIQLTADRKSAQQKLSLDANDLKTLPNKHQSRLQELQSDIRSAQQQLTLAQQRLEQMKQLKELGGVPDSALFDTEENAIQRQQDWTTAEQQLIQAQNEMQLELNETRKSYVDNQKALTDAQQALTEAKVNHLQQTKQAQLNLTNSRLSLSQARRNLNLTVIVSPLDGLVSRANIHPGELAGPEKPLMSLTQNVVFKAYIDQARLNAVQVGDAATVRLVAYPGKTFQGRVIQLNPTVETNLQTSTQVGVNRQYTYSAWIQMADLAIPPGLQGYAEFAQDRLQVLAPENAVTHLSAGEGMVMLLEGDRAVLRKVQLGQRVENQREVIAGLKMGERVVLSPRSLNPGDRLKAELTADH